MSFFFSSNEIDFHHRFSNLIFPFPEAAKNTQKTNFKFLSLSTISNIFKDFFTDKKYDAIIYTSELVEKSRIKLYNSVSALIRNNYGGFFFNEDSKFVKYYVHYFNLDIKDYILTNYKTYIKI